MSREVDARYYEVAGPGSLSEKVLVSARARIFSEFNTQMRPQHDETILDVGVSDVVTDGANFLERLYPRPEQITACGLGEARTFQSAHPQCAYVQIKPGDPLPFSDRQFAIATSNAVIEHLGSIEAQRAHVTELCRVAQRVFISAPNKFFPIEHHTAIPFLQWNDTTFRIASYLLNKTKWTDEKELILMTRARLLALKSKDRPARVGYTGIQLGPLSSNLFLAID